MKQKYASFNDVISEMFQWAAEGIGISTNFENVGSQVSIAMKDGKSDDLKSVGQIFNSGCSITCCSPTHMLQAFFYGNDRTVITDLLVISLILNCRSL